MGSCFSKQDDIPSKSNITTSQNRLGNAEKPKSTTTKPSTTRPQTTSRDTSTSQGHKLGSESNSNSLTNSREAAAKAAEERYNKLQSQGKDSQAKLKAMSKMSRQEKGL